MDIIYRATWQHDEGNRRRGEAMSLGSGRLAISRLGLALVVIGGCIGLLDGAASRTQRDRDAAGVVLVKTSEGD